MQLPRKILNWILIGALMIVWICVPLSVAADGARTIGSPFSDMLADAAITTDGGVILAGYTRTLDTRSDDILLVKLDSEGYLQWSKTYGGTEQDRGSAVIQTTDGGYMIVGSTMSFGAGLDDAWILKLDNTGEPIWQVTYGSESGDTAWDVIQDSGGNYIVVGVSSPFEGAPDGSIWILELDSDGDIVWKNGYIDDNYDAVFSLSVTAAQDGTYLITAGVSDVRTPGSANFWFLKIDSMGDLVWPRVVDGGHADISRAAALTKDGGFVLVGFTSSFGEEDYDAWVIKHNAKNEIEWQKNYDTSGDDRTNTVCALDDGSLVLAGTTKSLGSGTRDILFIKLNPDGQVLWERIFGGEGDELISSLLNSPNGGFIAAGYTSSFGAKKTDFWMLKLNDNGEIENCQSIADISVQTSDTDVRATTPSVQSVIVPEDTSSTNVDGIDCTLTVGDICESSEPFEISEDTGQDPVNSQNSEDSEESIAKIEANGDDGDEDEDGGGGNVSVIIGIVVGVLIVGLVMFAIVRRRQRKMQG